MELYERFLGDVEDIFSAFPDEDIIKKGRFYRLKEEAQTPEGVEEKSRKNNIEVMRYIASQSEDYATIKRALWSVENLRKQDDN